MHKLVVIFHSSFKKQYKKLRAGEQNRCDTRLLLFEQNYSHPLLDNHPLHGKYAGFWSINVGGDLRAVYEYVGGEIVRFVDVDTHSNLYGK